MQQPVAASISTNTSGDNAIIAAATGKTSRVVGLLLVAAGTVTVTVKRGLAGGATTLSGAMTLSAGVPLFLPIIPTGQGAYYTTAANEAFNLSLGGAVQVSGTIWYTQS